MNILQLTDLHFGIIETSEPDEQTKQLIMKLVKEHRPDMMVVTGDLVWSLTENSLDTFKEVINLLDGFGIPLAITFGNHDSEGDFDRSVINELILELKHFVQPEGLSYIDQRMNYYYSFETDGVNHRLYFIDTGDYDHMKIGEYDYVSHKQIDWLMEVDKDFEGVSQLFIHIPLPEYQEAVLRGMAEGNQEEVVCSPRLNTGLFSRILLESTIKAIYCGHDHDNDFSADYFGVQLNYGRVSGYNTYGSLERGGRLIKVEGESITSSIIV